jgi:hypothetical protein
LAKSISISISDSQFAKLSAELNPKQLKQAMFQAIKRTTDYARTKVRSTVKDKTYMRPKYINRAVNSKVSKSDPPEGLITISQRLVPLIAFKATVGKRGGARVHISKDKPAILLRHAFRARVKSYNQKAEDAGHLGIFLRSKHLPTKGPNMGKGKIGKHGRAWRLAIEEQFGASVLNLVEVPTVIAAIGADVQNQLEKNVQSQLDRFTK